MLLLSAIPWKHGVMSEPQVHNHKCPLPCSVTVKVNMSRSLRSSQRGILRRSIVQGHSCKILILRNEKTVITQSLIGEDLKNMVLCSSVSATDSNSTSKVSTELSRSPRSSTQKVNSLTAAATPPSLLHNQPFPLLVGFLQFVWLRHISRESLWVSYV